MFPSATTPTRTSHKRLIVGAHTNSVNRSPVTCMLQKSAGIDERKSEFVGRVKQQSHGYGSFSAPHHSPLQRTASSCSVANNWPARHVLPRSTSLPDYPNNDVNNRRTVVAIRRLNQQLWTDGHQTKISSASRKRHRRNESNDQLQKPKGCFQKFMSMMLKVFRLLFNIINASACVLLFCIASYKVVSNVREQACLHAMTFNITGLRDTLETEVYGQHIAVDIISKQIRNYLKYPGLPAKPLVLSFHGGTGIGKNFVSSIIADHVITSTVHTLIMPLQFPHADRADEYRHQLYNWVISHTSSCAVNLLIIDELDKVPPGMINGLQEALLHLKQHSSDTTKVIVLLISNTKGRELNVNVFNALRNGQVRESISSSQLLPIFNDSSSQTDTVWFSGLLKHNLIDAFVPFLPLQREHIRKCIHNYAMYKNLMLTNAQIEAVANQLTYGPKQKPLFSTSGCRKVGAKADLVLELS